IYSQYIEREKAYSLRVANPIIAAQWHPTKNNGVLPDYVSACSNKRAWWLCPVCNHEWDAVINSRNKGAGCPKCGIKKRTKRQK
ncbi:MAG: zinc-ribbon domain-containing protein, partial [Clostridia bacterium]|nr:zinc-ribbon domain-containing protein [Clostridia bacterium]